MNPCSFTPTPQTNLYSIYTLSLPPFLSVRVPLPGSYEVFTSLKDRSPHLVIIGLNQSGFPHVAERNETSLLQYTRTPPGASGMTYSSPYSDSPMLILSYFLSSLLSRLLHFLLWCLSVQVTVSIHKRALNNLFSYSYSYIRANTLISSICQWRPTLYTFMMLHIIVNQTVFFWLCLVRTPWVSVSLCIAQS